MSKPLKLNAAARVFEPADKDREETKDTIAVWVSVDGDVAEVQVPAKPGHVDSLRDAVKAKFQLELAAPKLRVFGNTKPKPTEPLKASASISSYTTSEDEPLLVEIAASEPRKKGSKRKKESADPKDRKDSKDKDSDAGSPEKKAKPICAEHWRLGIQQLAALRTLSLGGAVSEDMVELLFDEDDVLSSVGSASEGKTDAMDCDKQPKKFAQFKSRAMDLRNRAEVAIRSNDQVQFKGICVDVFKLLSLLRQRAVVYVPDGLYLGAGVEASAGPSSRSVGLGRGVLVHDMIGDVFFHERANRGLGPADNRGSKLIFGAKNVGKSTLMHALLGAVAVLCSKLLPTYVSYVPTEMPLPSEIVEFAAPLFSRRHLGGTHLSTGAAVIGSDEFQCIYPAPLPHDAHNTKTEYTRGAVITGELAIHSTEYAMSWITGSCSDLPAKAFGCRRKVSATGDQYLAYADLNNTKHTEARLETLHGEAEFRAFCQHVRPGREFSHGELCDLLWRCGTTPGSVEAALRGSSRFSYTPNLPNVDGPTTPVHPYLYVLSSFLERVDCPIDKLDPFTIPALPKASVLNIINLQMAIGWPREDESSAEVLRVWMDRGWVAETDSGIALQHPDQLREFGAWKGKTLSLHEMAALEPAPDDMPTQGHGYELLQIAGYAEQFDLKYDPHTKLSFADKSESKWNVFFFKKKGDEEYLRDRIMTRTAENGLDGFCFGSQECYQVKCNFKVPVNETAALSMISRCGRDFAAWKRGFIDRGVFASDTEADEKMANWTFIFFIRGGVDEAARSLLSDTIKISGKSYNSRLYAGVECVELLRKDARDHLRSRGVAMAL